LWLQNTELKILYVRIIKCNNRNLDDDVTRNTGENNHHTIFLYFADRETWLNNFGE